MILTIPYCHRDLAQALKLIRWIAFLSSRHGHAMKKERLLLVPNEPATKRRLHYEILDLAPRVFGTAYLHVMAVPEVGWPGACNFMFMGALAHVEEHFREDMFFLEPDAIPVVPDWFDTWKAEWAVARQRGKVFMGAFVGAPPGPVDHMTGNGVYGANWRRVAPSLMTVPAHGAWDCSAAPEVMPHAHFTGLFQHEWFKEPIATSQISAEAVIYHRDKKGRMIDLLDDQEYGGQANESFGVSKQEEEITTMIYFHADNANRVIKSQQYEFRFEQYDCFGGSWRGLYATENEGEIIALSALTQDPRTAVTELTQAEYDAIAKKKPAPSPASKAWSPPPGARINQSPAALVVNPQSPEPAPAAPVYGEAGAPQVENLDAVLELGQVKTQPAPPVQKSARPRKTPPAAPTG